MQNYGRDQAHSIYKLKQLCRPYYQLLIFVASWDGFLCRLHFLFRLVFLFVPTFCFSNYWFPKFLSLYYCLLVFFASFVFRFSTTDVQRWYNAHNTKKNRTRYARLGRRLELKWSRFRPRCEKVRSSPHVLLCWWLFHFAASTYNPGDLVDCRHKRGVLSTRVVAVGPHGLGRCSIILSISICLIHVWKYCCTRGFARYADRWTSCALGCNGNSASAMVHLTSSNGDSANTDRYFVHKTSSCEHCPAENVVFLKL